MQPAPSPTSIPLADLSPFFASSTSSDSHSSKVSAAVSLVNACSTLGFAYITGLGNASEDIAEAFRWNKKFFHLPHEEKMKAPHPKAPMPHRGYSAVGVEKVYSREEREGEKGEGLRDVEDFKESFEIGSPHNAFQPNIFPPPSVLPGFEEYMLSLYVKLHTVARTILAALALGLDLRDSEREHLLSLCTGQNNQLRLLHYPPLEEGKADGKVVGRMPAHQDWSCFTILWQDDEDEGGEVEGGLELEDPSRKGTWLKASPPRGAAVLNVGDMMERLTNGRFQSAMHRVTVPQVEGQTRARYSVPYFFCVDHEAVVAPLPSCVEEKVEAKYEPVRWCDYGDWIAKYSYGTEKES